MSYRGLTTMSIPTGLLIDDRHVYLTFGGLFMFVYYLQLYTANCLFPLFQKPRFIWDVYFPRPATISDMYAKSCTTPARVEVQTFLSK